MKRIIIWFVALLCVAAFAQTRPMPRATRPVTDPSMLINDRGVLLEVLATQRATPATSRMGQRIYRAVSADASAPINGKQPGVVYNHAMRAEGYTTGEIALKFKGSSPPPSGFSQLYPGFKKLTNPNVYVVVARTPAEFVQLTKTLQQRSDLEWVEPIVNYTPVVPLPAAPASHRPQ